MKNPRKTKPFVSVVVPTLNEEKHVASCLESIRESVKVLGKPCEIIVADGGSTDKTVKEAKKLCDKIVFERKHTIAAGRQKGAEAARGGFLVFTDADSVFDRNWLKELLEPFEDGKVSGVFGAIQLKHASWWQNVLAKYVFSAYLWASNSMGFPSGAGANLAARTDSFEKVKGFNEELVTGEDLDLQRRLKRVGRIIFAHKAVAFVSARRLRKWGLPYFLYFHARNWIRFHLLGKKPLGKYERIRE